MYMNSVHRSTTASLWMSKNQPSVGKSTWNLSRQRENINNERNGKSRRKYTESLCKNYSSKTLDNVLTSLVCYRSKQNQYIKQFSLQHNFTLRRIKSIKNC